MDENFQIKRKKTFSSIFNLYFVINFFIGIMPVNIDNLLIYLPKTTEFGVGFAIASNLVVGIISILFFGYYAEKIAEKFKKKNICFN